MMDEDEIDGWYEEEKERIFQKYTELLEQKGREIAEKKFEDEMDKLMKDYNKKYDDLEKGKKLKARIKPVQDTSKKISGFIREVKEIYK